MIIRKKLQIVTIFVVLSLVLISCGRGHRNSDSNMPLQNTSDNKVIVPESPVVTDFVPFPAMPSGKYPKSAVRQVSDTGYTVNGKDYIATVGVFNKIYIPGSQSYSIISDAENKIAYAQYNVENLKTSRPVKMEFNISTFTIPPEENPLPLYYYIGIANFTKYAWEWKGPFTDADPTKFEIELNNKQLLDRYVDNIGTLHFVVITSVKDSPKLSESGKVGLTFNSCTTTISPNYLSNNPHYVPIKSIYTGKKVTTSLSSINLLEKSTSSLEPDTLVNPFEPIRSTSALTSDQFITIEWEHVPAFNEPDRQNEALTYQIYRKGRNDKAFVFIGIIDAPNTVYHDPTDNAKQSPVIPEPVPGEKYEYSLSAVTPKEQYCPKSTPNSVVPQILAPTGVKATIGLEAEIRLDWDETLGAVDFEIWSSDLPNDPNITKLATVSAQDSGQPNTYSDKTAEAGKIRYYRIKAVGLASTIKEATSAFSSEVYGVTGEVLFPPTDVTATDGTSTTAITVTWKAPKEGSPPEGYSIWRSNSETGEYTKITDVGAVLTYDDPVLTNDTYWYKVKSTRSGVTDSVFADNADSGIKKQPVMPPNNLQSSKGNYDSKISLLWEAPTAGLAPDKYLIYRSVKQDSDFVKITEVTGALSYDDTTITNGATYWYKIKSQNGSDISGYSTEDYGYLMSLSPPLNLTATDNKYLDRVRVDWLAPTTGPKPDGYYIYRSAKSDSDFTQIANVTQPTLSYEDKLVPDGHIHYYKAVAYKATYPNSPDSSIDGGYVTKLTPPGDVKATDGEYSTKVIITWTHTSVQIPDGYYIYRAASEFGTYEKIGTVGYSSFYEDNAVPNGYLQWYKVASFKKLFDDSLFSEANDGFVTQLLTPTNLQATDGFYSDKIHLSWTHSAGVKPDGYDIYRSSSQLGTYTKISTVGYVTDFDDTTPPTLENYWYRLKAIKTNYADSIVSVEDSGFLAQLNSPTNVSATDGTFSTKIVVTWSHPVGQKPDGYDIYRYSLQSGVYSKIDSVGYVATYDDTSTPEAGTYWYKIKSTTVKFGDSEFSNEDSGSNEIRSNWWMFGLDTTHNRRSAVIGAATNTLKWSYSVSNMVRSSAAIGADGTVYIGSSDNNLYAFNPNGTLKWSFATGIVNYSSPAIGSDGTIYVGSAKLYAIKPDGKLKWSYTPGGSINYSSPAVGEDGSVYFGCLDNKLYAVDSTGVLKWTYSTSGAVRSSAAIDHDGTIYFGSMDKNLYAINPNGSLKWKYTAGDQIWSSPAIGADGTIYVGSYDNKLHAIHPDGSAYWTYTTAGWVTSSPAIDSNGTIYVGSWDGKLYALNADGTLKWLYTTGSIIHSSPAISANGLVYIGSQDKYLHAVNPNGTLKWQLLAGNYVLSSPAIGSDGTVYFGSDDNKIYAVGPGSGTTGLNPPSNISASDGTYADKVRITWTAPASGPSPEGYYIYRSQSNTVTAIYRFIGYSYSSMFDDTTAISGTTYYYKIQSYKSASGYNDSVFSAFDAGNR